MELSRTKIDRFRVPSTVMNIVNWRFDGNFKTMVLPDRTLFQSFSNRWHVQVCTTYRNRREQRVLNVYSTRVIIERVYNEYRYERFVVLANDSTAGRFPLLAERGNPLDRVDNTRQCPWPVTEKKFGRSAAVLRTVRENAAKTRAFACCLVVRLCDSCETCIRTRTIVELMYNKVWLLNNETKRE